MLHSTSHNTTKTNEFQISGSAGYGGFGVFGTGGRNHQDSRQVAGGSGDDTETGTRAYKYYQMHTEKQGAAHLLLEPWRSESKWSFDRHQAKEFISLFIDWAADIADAQELLSVTETTPRVNPFLSGPSSAKLRGKLKDHLKAWGSKLFAHVWVGKEAGKVTELEGDERSGAEQHKKKKARMNVDQDGSNVGAGFVTPFGGVAGNHSESTQVANGNSRDDSLAKANGNNAAKANGKSWATAGVTNRSDAHKMWEVMFQWMDGTKVG